MKKNNNNQFTFNQNNNSNLNLNENENKKVLRGRPTKLKLDKTKLKNNRISNNNEINNMNYDNNYENDENNNILNKYEDNSNIPEEDEIETQNNNENNNNNVNENEDVRLNYVMEKLGLESLIGVFESYHMSFNDVLFLTKDDLNELGFKIYQKNRLISFIEEYTSKAKNFTLDEIKEFFEENNIYNITNNQ